MTPSRTILLFLLLLAAGCSAVPMPRMPRIAIWPGGAAPDRLVMAAEARAQTRARNPDGSWAVADPVAGSDYRQDFAANCVTDTRGTACADHAPVQMPTTTQTAPQITGRVAIAFAALSDGSRCTEKRARVQAGPRKTCWSCAALPARTAPCPAPAAWRAWPATATRSPGTRSRMPASFWRCVPA